MIVMCVRLHTRCAQLALHARGLELFTELMSELSKVKPQVTPTGVA